MVSLDQTVHKNFLAAELSATYGGDIAVTPSVAGELSSPLAETRYRIQFVAPLHHVPPRRLRGHALLNGTPHSLLCRGWNVLALGVIRQSGL